MIAAQLLFRVPATRLPGPPAVAAVDYTPAPLPGSAVGIFKVSESWTVLVDDSRFGGVSGLAMDGDRLLALTDSGVIAWLPRPRAGRAAVIRDLPDGPGSPRFKRNRDSEALTADPAGRGWWVAYENRHSLWLYDAQFRRSLARISLADRDFAANRGVEGLTGGAGQLTLWREWPGELPLGTSVADAARGPDGTIWLALRSFGLGGVINRIGRLDGERVIDAVVLPLGRSDNVEGIAAERGQSGGTRLWLITDNDFSVRRPTRLIALETP